MSTDDVTIGELARRVDRLDARVEHLDGEVASGFKAIQETIAALSYVPSAVYATGQQAMADRIARIEDESKTAAQRAWQSRLALTIALVGIPASVLSGVVTAAVTK